MKKGKVYEMEIEDIPEEKSIEEKEFEVEDVVTQNIPEKLAMILGLDSSAFRINKNKVSLVAVVRGTKTNQRYSVYLRYNRSSKQDEIVSRHDSSKGIIQSWHKKD